MSKLMPGKMELNEDPIINNIYDDDNMVNHPSYYQGESIEVIDIIEEFNLGFSLGNVIKYILRADYKEDDIQDLNKALWYLERELKYRTE